MFGLSPPEDATPGAQIVHLLFSFLIIAIFIRILLSWFQLDPRNPLLAALDSITEPILEPFRRIIPRIGMFDISPMVALIVLRIAAGAIVQLMTDSGI